MADQDSRRRTREPRAANQPAGDEVGQPPDPLTHVRRSISVYREILTFEHDLLLRMRTWVTSYPEAIRKAIQSSDIEPMELLVEQFRERLGYWQERERQLARADKEATRE